MTLSFNFGEVDAHGQKLSTIVSDMQNSLQALQKLSGELDAVFQGTAGSMYQETAGAFNKQLASYQSALGAVQNAVMTTSGSQGLMQVTDQNNGKLFSM
jgi:uncharacterized protein YukE